MPPTSQYVLLLGTSVVTLVTFIGLYLRKDKNDRPTWVNNVEKCIPVTCIILTIVIGLLIAQICSRPLPSQASPGTALAQYILKLQKNYFSQYAQQTIQAMGKDFGWGRNSEKKTGEERQNLILNISALGTTMQNRVSQFRNLGHEYVAMLSSDHPESHRKAINEFVAEMVDLSAWIESNLINISTGDDLGVLHDDVKKELNKCQERIFAIKIMISTEID